MNLQNASITMEAMQVSILVFVLSDIRPPIIAERIAQIAYILGLAIDYNLNIAAQGNQ